LVVRLYAIAESNDLPSSDSRFRRVCRVIGSFLSPAGRGKTGD
jgi:hypothetical protein